MKTEKIFSISLLVALMCLYVPIPFVSVKSLGGIIIIINAIYLALK